MQLQMFILFVFARGNPHDAPRDQSWQLLRGPYEKPAIKPRSVTCKASALPSALLLARSNLKGPDLCCPFFVWLDFWGAKPSNTQRLNLVMRSGVIPRGACPKDLMRYQGSNPSWPHARQMLPPPHCVIALARVVLSMGQ